MYQSFISMICLALGLILLQGAGYAEELVVGDFSNQDADKKWPASWVPMTFSNIEAHTRYSLIQDKGRTVIRAHSHNAASGLIRNVRVDPHEYPWLQWSWKIDHVLKKGDVTTKKGDDYAARIYVAFAFDPDQSGLWQRMKHKTASLMSDQELPGSALNYIWASKAAPGTIVPNPYASEAMMVVLQSGNARSDQWIQEQRNIVEDYKRAFGKQPPEIIGIAIMTDTDNTGEETTGYYGDITLGTKKEGLSPEHTMPQ
jgi:hypothetical protein